MTMAASGFRPVGEVTADDRARLSMGKAGVTGDERFAVAINDDGEILLTPVASVPKRELIIWDNEQLRQSLARGLEQVEAGKVHSAGSFAEYLNDDE